jgi:hypothetical protein
MLLHLQRPVERGELFHLPGPVRPNQLQLVRGDRDLSAVPALLYRTAMRWARHLGDMDIAELRLHLPEQLGRRHQLPYLPVPVARR